MAYDSSPLRRQDADPADPVGSQQRFAGEPGFREEPDFQARATYQVPAYSAADDATAVAGAVPPAVLDDVFDDPADGTPGRDRLGVHWVWELVLLLGVASLAALLWQAQPDALRGGNLSALLVVASGFLLLALAAGVSLRAAVPNLAIGPVAVAAGVYFAERGAEGVGAPTVMAVLVALAIGAVLAAVVVTLQVPAWAASLAAAGGVVVWLYQQPPEVPLTGAFDPTGRAPVLFVAVAAVAIVGGVVGTVKPIRRALSRYRPVGDPASRRGVLAALVAAAALMLSMVLAVLAGVLLTAGAGAPVPASSGTQWFELTVIGFAVALIGGTSAFGRRGGVFGAPLAALALVLFDRYQQVTGWSIALLATASAAVVAGLVVTRIVERFGRPYSAEVDELAWSTSPAAPRAEAASSSPAASQPTDSWATGAGAWASSLPAQPAQDHPTAWDERWSR
jgi:ribose/xylose/arabinose/galactoside ABC-type transport system permease subunit